MSEDILALIDADASLREVYAYVDRHFDSDAAHDIAHCLRVARWTMRLAGDGVPERLSIAAALLHDIVNVPKNHPDRALASERSAEVATSLLRELAFDAGDVEMVAEAIRDHSFTRGAVPESTLGKALQDADRLEALGVIGTFRCIATGVGFGAEFFDANDPWAQRRQLDDTRYSVDHFFTKLLRLPSTFQTADGRREAERRAETMREMLRALETELGVTRAVTPTSGPSAQTPRR
jgi:uncharacterized protein